MDVFYSLPFGNSNFLFSCKEIIAIEKFEVTTHIVQQRYYYRTITLQLFICKEKNPDAQRNPPQGSRVVKILNLLFHIHISFRPTVNVNTDILFHIVFERGLKFFVQYTLWTSRKVGLLVNFSRLNLSMSLSLSYVTLYTSYLSGLSSCSVRASRCL